MNEAGKNLIFLLSAAPMAIFGCDGDDGDGSTGADESSDSETGNGETGDGDSGICDDYAAVKSMCDEPDEYAAYYCHYHIDGGMMYYGMACADAIEAYFACLSKLSCENFLMLKGCEAEQQAYPMICQ